MTDLSASTAHPMEQVEALTRAYAERRDALRMHIEDVRARIEAIERAALPEIRIQVREVAEAHDRLQAAIGAHPALWAGKRRTVVIAGVRVGMAKGKGKIEWDDPDQVVRLIRREFPDQAEALIRTREEPIRKAISELTVAELKRIGARITDTDDQVVITPTDSAVDKLVAALLSDAERIEAAAAAD